MQHAPLFQIVQDTVTQQFLRLKDAVTQEMQRCIREVATKTSMCEDLLQRLEADYGVRQSALLGLRHDSDRQQAQITELVQSRLSASAVQDQALRDRDEEISISMENLRRDVEVMKSQYRNALAGNAASVEQQQRVEKSCLELRRDLEGIQAENQRYRNVLPKMEKAIVELRGKLTEEKDGQRANQDKQVQQLSDFSTQLSTVQEHQQQVERVVLELRKDRQREAEEFQGVVAGLQILKERADDQQKTCVEQQQMILELRNAAQMQDLEGRKNQLSTSFGSEIMAKVDKMEENIKQPMMLVETVQRLQRDSERSTQICQDLSQMINSESTARKELAQLVNLDAYHSSAQVLQERVAAVETVQIEDQGRREGTMQQMGENLAELVNQNQIETELRAQCVREATRQAAELGELKRLLSAERASREEMVEAHLKMSSDIRKDHAQLLQVESEARLNFFGEFDAHRASSKSAFGRFDRLESELKGCQQTLEEGLLAEEAGRNSQRAESRADFQKLISTSTGLRAEMDMAIEKLRRLEAVDEDNEARQGQVTENIERRLSELHKFVRDNVGSETASLRGGLESVKSSLTTSIADSEVERGRRAQEALDLKAEIKAMQSQFSQIETMCADGEGRVENLRSYLLKDTEPAMQSLKNSVSNSLNAVARDVKQQGAAMAQETSQLQSGLRVMQERLAGLETVSTEDRGWRQQAVQDLEGILGEIKHITPTAASTRALPTLASALRLCKSEVDRD